MTILTKNIKNLPDVLIHKIFDYTDIIIYRNGKYIDRISKENKRYKILLKIPTPLKVGPNKVLLHLFTFTTK